MALYTRTGMAPAIRKPNKRPEATQDKEDWVDELAKVMEARRAGQRMREGKPLILSKNKPFKLLPCALQT